MKYFLAVFCCCLITSLSLGQTSTDSLLQNADSPTQPKITVPPIKKDSTRKRPVAKKNFDSITIVIDSAKQVKADSISQNRDDFKKAFAIFEDVLRRHPYYNFFGKPIVLLVHEKQENDSETLFYVLLGLYFYFGLIKLFFGKYLSNLLTLFFRVTMRQQQLREQLLQAALPSLLLNILFILSFGLYLGFVLSYYRAFPNLQFGVLTGYCMAFLVVIYVVKYLTLKMMGWVFKASGATDTYIFIVFLVNKMIGIFLLPVLILLAFPHKYIFPVALTTSFILLFVLYAYRFIISYRPIRNEIKVNLFHFFLYLCAFEIAPLLLVYKLLTNYVGSSI